MQGIIIIIIIITVVFHQFDNELDHQLIFLSIWFCSQTEQLGIALTVLYSLVIRDHYNYSYYNAGLFSNLQRYTSERKALQVDQLIIIHLLSRHSN